MDELLRLSRLHYKYEEKYPALKDVSVSLYQGERIAVLGNNGAGKSTFFLCCNGVLQPQEGEIFLRGQKLSRQKQDISLLRQAVGLVFQEPDNQIIAGTVANEVSFGPMNLGLPYDEVLRRIEQSLTRMNLDGYQDRAPHYLSGGEKKRVSIADILAMEPAIILFDEPTASLDPQNVALLEQTLSELSQAGITLAVSTHDVDFAYRFANRAIVFSRGEVIADAPIDEVFASGAVLSQAGLEKPLLYAASSLLEQRWPELGGQKKPRTIPEFQAFLNK